MPDNDKILQDPNSSPWSQSDKKDVNSHRINGSHKNGLLGWFRTLVKGKPDSTLRETLEEFIEEPEGAETQSLSVQEKLLLSNILKLQDIAVFDVMVPRAEVVAVPDTMSQPELMSLLSERQFNRIPVYNETLDNIIGVLHIKDIIGALAKAEAINIKALVTDVPIVSPAMPVLDLLLEMRESRRHMALVVDEFGGIDGLVTIGDVIESIVGEINDEHNQDTPPQILEREDGSILVDARLDVDDFEERFGQILSPVEREESETLGGLVFLLAGHIPARGEVLKHDSGMIFEVAEAGPRRINRLRIRNIPQNVDAQHEQAG